MSFLVTSMILIAIDITVPATAVGAAALVTVLLATVSLLVGLTLPLLSVRKSISAVTYEVDRTATWTRRRGSRPLECDASHTTAVTWFAIRIMTRRHCRGAPVGGCSWTDRRRVGGPSFDSSGRPNGALVREPRSPVGLLLVRWPVTGR